MKNRITKISLFLVALFAIIICSFGVDSKTAYADKKVVKVGVYDLKNFHSFDENGEVQGYDVDYLDEIAKITGWSYEYVKADSWASAIDMLKNGQIDILSPAQITSDRMNEFGFSAFPIGKVYAAILTNKENTDIIYEDFDEFNNMTFGIEKGNTYKDIFENYAKEHGFTPKIELFENHDALVKALNDKKVNAIVANIMRADDNMRLIGKAGTALYYYMFRKDDASFGAKLNDALDRIEIANSNFQNQLVEKYFPIYNDNQFTKEEMDFIDSLPVIKIATRGDAKPLAYVDEDSGQMKGIYIDYLKKAAQYSGLKLEFVPMDVKLDKDTFSANDVGLTVYPTSQIKKNKDIVSSDIFWNTQEVIVCNVDGKFDTSKELSLTYCSDSTDYEDILHNKYPNFKLVRRENLDDCFESVQKGDADCLIANQYMVDLILKKPVYEDLSIVPDAGMVQSFSLVALNLDGVGNEYTKDTRLMKIFNKAFDNISEQEVSQIVINYTTGMPYELTNKDLAYKFRIQIILVILLLLMIVGGCAGMLFVSNKSKRKIEESNEKLEAANEQLEKANASLEIAVKKANAANVAKSQFLAQMSHEIRTPMNAIIGLTTIASRDLSDTNKTKDSLMKIDGASKLLLGIINDVLDMSAIESKKMKLANMEFDFKELLSSITAVFYQQCKQKNIDFELKMKGVTEEILIGDSLRVNQILMNLLSNAVKFTPAGGRIDVNVIQAFLSNNTVQIRFVVSDTGCGMSEELQKRLFNPFEQESATTARKHGGSGLGLAITKNLVEMMNGLISVESTKNVGTKFTVDIPFDVVKTHMPVDENAFADIHTLIVDDDSDSREYTGLLMERLGIQYDCVDSGEQALDMMGEAEDGGDPFNLCIVDWKMPEMNGLDLTQNIREVFGNDAIVIIVSAYDREEVEDNGYKAGADYFIPKPLFQSSVYNIITQISHNNGKKISNSQGEAKEHMFTGRKALLAEDVALNMEVAVELLKYVGVECVCAEDGAIAVDIFKRSKENEFDIILLDINMPNMDGYEAARQLRALDREDIKTMPIYAMTANAFAEDIASSLDAGMNGHISKPIEPGVLYRTLETAWEDKK